jgi:hypothetical protein
MSIMNIASFVFILVLACTNLLLARGTRQLTAEQKVRLAENSSSSTGWLLVAIAVVCGLEALFTHFTGYSREMLLAFMAIIFLLAFGFSVFQQRRLARLDLPVAFLRTNLIGMLLNNLAMLALFASMFYGPVQLLGR